MENNLSTKVTKTIIKYVEEKGGDVDLLIEGLPYSKEFLVSNDGWLPSKIEFVLLERARIMLMEEDISQNIGRFSNSPDVLGLLGTLARMFGNPKALFKRAGSYAPYFDRSQRAQTKLINKNECIMEVWDNEENKDYKYSGCEYAVGIFEAIPTLFGLPKAMVTKETCRCPIHSAGRVKGLYYSVDESSNVSAFLDEERTQFAGARGHLETDGTYMLDGIKFGAETCRYHITYHQKFGVLSRIKDWIYKRQYSGYVAELERTNTLLEKRFDEFKQQDLRRTRYGQLNMALVQQQSLEELLALVTNFAVELGAATISRIYLVDDNGKIMVRSGGEAFGNNNHLLKLKKIFEEYDLHGEKLDASTHPELEEIMRSGAPRVYNKVVDFMPLYWPMEACRKLDEEGDIKQIAFFPLKYDKDGLGIMSVISAHEIDLEVLQPLANMAALAIWNVRRIEQINGQKKRLERFVEIQYAMNQKRDITQLLDFIVRSAQELTSCVTARIFIINPESKTIARKHVSLNAPKISDFIKYSLAKSPVPINTLSVDESVLYENLKIHGFEKNTIFRPDGIHGLMKGYWPKEFCDWIEKELGIRDIAATPLINEDKEIGLMLFTSETKLDDNLLLMLAGQAAQAILEAQYIDEIRESRDNLDGKVRERTRDLDDANRQLKENHGILLQQEKMASIGQLAAGLAHEINNPISYVYSNLNVLGEYAVEIKECYLKFHDLFEVARQSTDGGVKQKAEEFGRTINDNDMDDMITDVGELVKESHDGALRVKDIVQNLGHFSRPGEKHPIDSDINLGLERTLMVIWNELKYKVTIHKDFKTLPYIRCYPQELNQVFMNIILNASQAIGEKGDIWVSTDVKDDAIRIMIEDNGKGIAPEHINKIFEPFFTTKEVGSGKGLGLAMSYNIVKQHDGRILVESAYGKGSKFTIMLPVVGIPESIDEIAEANMGDSIPNSMQVGEQHPAPAIESISAGKEILP